MIESIAKIVSTIATLKLVKAVVRLSFFLDKIVSLIAEHQLNKLMAIKLQIAKYICIFYLLVYLV